MARLWMISRQLISDLFLPAIFLVWLASEQHDSILEWLLFLAGITFYVVFLYLREVWVWINYYLRYTLLVALLVAAVCSGRNVLQLPLHFENSHNLHVGIVFLALFIPLVIACIRGLRPVGLALRLVFPLRRGRYYISQGGSNPLLNQHPVGEGACRGVDIVKLDRAGFRARSLYPDQLSDYYIYGDPVFSPVDGWVVKVVDNLPDMSPAEDDLCHPAGNYIALQPYSSRVQIYLMHLQPGSLAVKAGDSVRRGQLLGRVGNSGVTTEPHLHIHAAIETKQGLFRKRGVHLLFDGRYLHRNSLVLYEPDAQRN